MTQDLENGYQKLLQLYDIAEDFVNTVDSSEVIDQRQQLDLVEPIIEELEESADILTNEFAALAEAGGDVKTLKKNKIESALRKLFTAIDEYHKRVAAISDKLENVASSVVERLRELAEDIVVVFLQLIDLSLDKIMHKKQVEEMKKRHGIMNILHQHSAQAKLA